MPGAASCQRAAARQGRPVQPGGSDVAAGRVTLPALCSYQCETGLGRRLSVPPPPAGSGGCAGAPGAQGRGRGGRGGSRPAPSRGCCGRSRCTAANPVPMSPPAPRRDAGCPRAASTADVFTLETDIFICVRLYTWVRLCRRSASAAVWRCRQIRLPSKGRQGELPGAAAVGREHRGTRAAARRRRARERSAQ